MIKATFKYNNEGDDERRVLMVLIENGVPIVSKIKTGIFSNKVTVMLLHYKEFQDILYKLNQVCRNAVIPTKLIDTDTEEKK